MENDGCRVRGGGSQPVGLEFGERVTAKVGPGRTGVVDFDASSFSAIDRQPIGRHNVS